MRWEEKTKAWGKTSSGRGNSKFECLEVEAYSQCAWSETILREREVGDELREGRSDAGHRDSGHRDAGFSLSETGRQRRVPSVGFFTCEE